MTKTVGIIGAGPAGMAVARALLGNTNFDITIFEKEEHVGGLWNYTPGNRHTSMYDNLESNIIKQVMAFRDFPFPDYDPTFPPRQRILEYLRLYFVQFIKGRAKVLFNSTVVSLEKPPMEPRWEIRLENGQVHLLDYVVVANGHYNRGYLPMTIPGLHEWASRNTHACVHAKWFTNSEYARGKTIVVVGNGDTGIDIANQLSSVAFKVYHSVQDTAATPWKSESNVEAVGVISDIQPSSNTISFDSGDIVHGVDQIIWATGYRYDVPFLKNYRDILFPSDLSAGVHKICGLWENVVFTRDPTLTFALLCNGVIPFPFAELQGCLIGQVYEGRISRQEMAALSSFPAKPASLNFTFPADINYYKHIQTLIDSHTSPEDTFQPVKWDKHLRKLCKNSRYLKKLRTKELIRRSRNLRQIGAAYTQ